MKLIIFDLDGTLLDTLADLQTSCNTVLQQYGYATHPLSAYKQFVGNGVRKLVERALPEEARSSGVIDRVLDDFKIEYRKMGNRYTHPYAGIDKMLSDVQSAGFLISIASNKYHEAVVDLVHVHFPKLTFDLVLGHRDGHPAKPDPEIVFDTLQTLQVNTQDCYYVGDSDVDMQTAKAAGVVPIGVSWGFRGEEELLSNGATYIVHQPTDLLNIFNIIRLSIDE